MTYKILVNISKMMNYRLIGQTGDNKVNIFKELLEQINKRTDL
jgi:hypothetical protein